jgi:integrating conjugative element membrane protein (TIGR03747 family)
LSDSAGPAQNPQQRPPSLLAKLVLLPFALFGMLCGSLLLSITIECVGVALFWPEQGEGHVREMLEYELEQLSENFTQSLLLQAPGRAARELTARASDWVFIRACSR